MEARFNIEESYSYRKKEKEEEENEFPLLVKGKSKAAEERGVEGRSNCSCRFSL